MNELLIIRPKARWARWQGASGIALAAVLVAGVGFSRGSVDLLASILVIGTVLVAAMVYQWRLRQNGPQAIVATSEYLGLLAANGERRVLHWDAVGRAAHSTGFSGMRWKLRSRSGAIIVPDVGVDPDQWKRLWWRVGFEVSRRGAPVVVDRVSNTLFDP
jgi:hypothetical protein